MQEIIKELTISDATLSMLEDGRRIQLADFNGKVEIKSEQFYIPVLGERCKGEKRIIASFILCDNIKYQSCERCFNSGRAYEAAGSVTGEHQSNRMIFSGLKYDDMDPVKGTVTFEITDLNIIQKMLTM